MNAAANVMPFTAVPQASSTASKSPVLKSSIDVTSLDGEVQALLTALRPTVIVSPQSTPKPDAVNVTSNAVQGTEIDGVNTDAVQALSATQGMEIDGLILTLLKTEADDFKRQIAAQCTTIMLAVVEKYRLEKLLQAKEREIENYKPFTIESIKPADPEPVKEIEVVTIEDDGDTVMLPPQLQPVLECGHCCCGDPVVEGSDYCADPDHDYDGFAQRMPDFDCDLYPTDDDTMLPSIDLSPLIAASSQDSSMVSSLLDDDVFTAPAEISSFATLSEISSTPEDQYIVPSQLPPSIRKRGYVYKCYHGGCHKPETVEGGFFCGEHAPENQLGNPALFNEYYGITTPIKRHKMFFPLMKTRRKKPTLKKFKKILPKY